MKIGFVLDDTLDSTDGVQQYVLSLGAHYTARGHDVHYLVGQTKRSDLPNIHALSKNLQVRFNKNRMSTPLPGKSRDIKQLLSREQFDVLHVQVPYSPFMAGKVMRFAGPDILVVGTFHIAPYAWQVTWGTRALRLLLMRSLGRFDVRLAVSSAAADLAASALGYQAQVIPNVVDIDRYAGTDKHPAYDNGKKTIVFLGRLVPRKGALHLLKALALLQARGQLKNTQVVMVGKGPMRSKLEKFVADNNLQDTVVFHGFATEEEKPQLLRAADVAVFPSTGGECFGIVLIEAMAAGARVVLGGDNPGYASVMTRKDQLFRPQDHLAFAKKLDLYLHNQSLQSEAHDWQKAYVKQFDTKKVGDQLLDLYTVQLAKKQSQEHNRS